MLTFPQLSPSGRECDAEVLAGGVISGASKNWNIHVNLPQGRMLLVPWLSGLDSGGSSPRP